MSTTPFPLLIATTNPGKFAHIHYDLADLSADLLSLTDLNIHDDVEETGETFQDNALLKARFYHEISGLPTIAEDSGIEVDALQGELGIKTRRWGAGAAATDEEWIAVFLDRMKDEPVRTARFRCCLVYKDAEGAEHLFEGTCEGEITSAVEAEYPERLPLKGCFRPIGHDQVLSALPWEFTRKIDHRSQALNQFRTLFPA